jgi:hypothetical protein
MSGTDDRADKSLPVTAEVGGEGGSYADPTMQEETFRGARGNRRVDQKSAAGGDGDVSAAAAEGEQVRDTGTMVKHATEPSDRH